jgi:hypothetical protein
MPESGVLALPLELGTLEPRAAAVTEHLSDRISSLCVRASALSAGQVSFARVLEAQHCSVVSTFSKDSAF